MTTISRLGFGHTRLNSTLFEIGKHNSGVLSARETLEHVMLCCQKYDAERKELIFNLKEMKVNYDLRDLLQIRSGEKCYPLLFQYRRKTKLIERI